MMDLLCLQEKSVQCALQKFFSGALYLFRKLYYIFNEKSCYFKKKQNNYSLIDHPCFNFISIPNFKSLTTIHQKDKAKIIIKKAVEEHDIIICRLPSASGVLAFKEAKKQGKPIFVENVACVFDALWNYDWRGKILAYYKYYKYKSIFKEASHVLYVTDKFLQRRYPTNGKSIGCSDVVLNEYDDQILRQRLNKIEQQSSVFKLATVAGIDVKYKGQDDVIKAIAQLKNKGILINYDIIGQGNPERLLSIINQFDVSDLVKIIGPLPHDKIFEYLKNDVDVYIQPSKQEGLPRAVIEAMSMACPIIGSNTGGIPELLNKAFIYPKGNIKALKNILTKIDKKTLLEQAQINFKKSKQYEKSYLENKRNNFYDEFLTDFNL